MRRRRLESVSAVPYGRCFASFVSSRSLSVRGSWGTAPSAFWYGAPGGTQGPLGKGGAAKRWRVAYPIGIATRHGAQPATTHTSKRNASATSGAHHAFAKDSTTPLGEKKLSAVNPSGSFHSPPPFTQGRLLVGAMPKARRNYVVVCAGNPSASLTAASSPYTGEPWGWGNADRRDKTKP